MKVIEVNCAQFCEMKLFCECQSISHCSLSQWLFRLTVCMHPINTVSQSTLAVNLFTFIQSVTVRVKVHEGVVRS